MPGRISPHILRAVEAVRWTSARRFPFTIQQLGDGIGAGDRSARRYLDTLEVAGVVERTQTRPSLYCSRMRLVDG
jgi:predicted ArsR family transcriptional regulator